MTNKIYQDVEVKGKASATGQISGASLNVTGEINGANLSSALLATLRDYFLPVGSRVKQRQGEQTPAAKFGGTWVVDTDYTGRTEIGSGTGYALGTTGGSADAVVVEHRGHILHTQTSSDLSAGEATYFLPIGSTLENSTFKPYVLRSGNEMVLRDFTEGESGTGKNMPPYKVVTVWKRTA